ncbi:expressed unknown protein [Ectocarpus siliculosus]|uniref:Uncharacterized protein n=1 Tax=Ectocarpus siliculosus TaxID=2880 RepID=D7G4V4_ECTSI|nr:expressed unknown protein [Ectocarpus siliculosus]|eukprot:CBJ27197.1 expressed unknown protein [Ectocarpus siliculosus]
MWSDAHQTVKDFFSHAAKVQNAWLESEKLADQQRGKNKAKGNKDIPAGEGGSSVSDGKEKRTERTTAPMKAAAAAAAATVDAEAQSKTTKDAPKGKQVARKATPDQPRHEEPEDLANSSSGSSSSASETIGASVRKKIAPPKRKASPPEGEPSAARKSSAPNTTVAAAEAKTADTRTPVTGAGSSASEAVGSSAEGAGHATKTVGRDGGGRVTSQDNSTNSGKDAAAAPSGVVSGGGTRGAGTSSAAPDTSKVKGPTLKRKRRSEPSDKTGTAKTSKESDVGGGSASAKGIRGDRGSKSKVAKFPGYLDSDDVSEKVLFGLPRGEKCPIDVLWEVEVQKSGRKTEQTESWFTSVVDLTKSLGTDEAGRPKFRINYARRGSLSASKSIVVFLTDSELRDNLQDESEEPLLWRKKGCQVASKPAATSSPRPSSAGSEGVDQEEEWADGFGMKSFRGR